MGGGQHLLFRGGPWISDDGGGGEEEEQRQKCFCASFLKRGCLRGGWGRRLGEVVGGVRGSFL